MYSPVWFSAVDLIELVTNNLCVWVISSDAFMYLVYVHKTLIKGNTCAKQIEWVWKSSWIRSKHNGTACTMIVPGTCCTSPITALSCYIGMTRNCTRACNWLCANCSCADYTTCINVVSILLAQFNICRGIYTNKYWHSGIHRKCMECINCNGFQICMPWFESWLGTQHDC